jgi:hypothetical protein
VPVLKKTPVRITDCESRGLEKGQLSASEISLGRSSLTIWGDSVVARALMLLLQSIGYEVKFLPALSLGPLLPLKGSSLLLLTPTPQLNKKERQAFLHSFRNTTESATMPVLELRVLGEEAQEENAKHEDSWHYVAWPCTTEELEQQIEVLISSHHGELEVKEQETLRARGRGHA